MSRPQRPFDPDDLVTAGVVADPYPAYRALRGRTPIRYLYIPDGALPQCPDRMQAWAVMTYDDVRRVLQDHESFSSRRPLAGRLMPRLVLLQDDPPRQAWLRGLVRDEFAPDRVARFEPGIARLADQLLDRVDGQETDFISAFAAPLPIRIIARLMGIPEKEHRTLRRWSDMALSVLSVPSEAKAEAREEIERFFKSMIAGKNPTGRPKTIIDLLINGKINGASLQEWEVIGFCILLLVAGSETTTNLLGNMFHILAHRPDLWNQLRRERTLVDPFIEEVLRYESPLQRLTRVTTRDIEVSNVRIPAGESVVAFIGAANRDPRKFRNPDEFDLHRPRSQALAFGSGIHHCLGAWLARTEARIAVNAILDRFSSVEPGSREPTRQTSKLLVLGYQSLPLTLKRGGVPKSRLGIKCEHRVD
jgi:cytochrome P450